MKKKEEEERFRESRSGAGRAKLLELGSSIDDKKGLRSVGCVNSCWLVHLHLAVLEWIVYDRCGTSVGSHVYR